MTIIDTHAHLNFNAYKTDFKAVIKKSLDDHIWLINVGSQYSTGQRAVEIAESYQEGVYAAVGLHPIHLATDLVKIKNETEEVEIKTKEESFDYQKYRELASSPKVVAIGEIGLDYYWRPKGTEKKEIFKQKQKDLFLEQLKLAEDLNLPVIFHCRMAHDDLINFLQLKINSKAKDSTFKLRGVMHGFVGTTEQLQEYLALGFYIGFNGIIFKEIEGIDFKENIKKTPLERILIETDCPYLTPLDQEGRNEPSYIKSVAEKIAQLKGLKPEEIFEITTKNAKDLFGI